MPRKTLEERFFAKVLPEPMSGCWLWTGTTTVFGHGQIWGGPERKRRILTHRLSWELHRGPIPKGGLVLHSCDVPACVNPDHLSIGDYSKNTKDAYERGRAVPTGGERNGMAVLTKEQALAIKLDTSHVDEIAAKFGVSRWTVYSIRSGKRWGCL